MQDDGLIKLEHMKDSEFLAFLLAEYFKSSKNEYVSDYVFNRLVKVLNELQKQEMN